MKKIFAFIFLSLVVTILNFACKKMPGPGGTSKITGRIWVRQYDKTFSTLNFKYWGGNYNVYILYGDEPGLSGQGQNTKTDYNGYFEFSYMLNGKYKVYAYSADSLAVIGPPLNPTAPQKAIVIEAEITKRKQTIDLGTIAILLNK